MRRRQADIATDPDAFEAFYRRHVDAITSFLARRVADPNTVADLVAEVFVAVLDSDDVARLEERIDAEGLARRAFQAMAGLPDGDRAMLELVVIDQLTITEAATALGIRQGAARARLHRARLLVRRRLATGAVVAGIAAAAAVAAPFLNGSETPAYAVTKNTDGTITLKINEFRDPARVEKDLAAVGLTADVSYVKPGTRCAPGRGTTDGPSFSKEELKSKDPEVRKRIREAIENSPNGRAFKLGGGEVRIDPRHIRPDQTAVMEFTENEDQTSGPEKPRALWEFGGYLVTGPVKPCKVVDDPSWDEMPDPKTNPEAYPPPGT
ncbi:sigma factor-like helix-turn-helix DNA-binding protein [Nonomuraea sp. NPDC050643]|uniref:RNA polymerase sigma factor n=1 Tax=Nonomuraea sp. NPDC050643 TaxID=3155660 RepID=UPI0033CE1B84